jgi:GNAT superfamily N-acetyltransferase
LSRRRRAGYDAAMADARYHLRRAAVDDAAIIGRHRAAMFRDMGWIGAHEVAALQAASAGALAGALAAADYRGWLAERDGAVAGGGGLVLRPLLPAPGHLAGGTEAYVLNVYVEPAHRRRGLARWLMDAMLAWCAARGVGRVSLHASDAGRPLYLTLGFTPTNELRRER